MCRLFILFVLLTSLSEISMAQYFGRNKPRYRDFKVVVKESPHFRIHHYLKNEEVVNNFTTMSEQWYDYHRSIMGEDILFKNPLILYNNHAEFQQTNSISGDIGVGTGGVTEAFKNRVVMPLTISNQQTYQVLGHELVHAFQFNSIINGDSSSLQNLSNLPLWLVEGMAEYMTLGRVDPFTSMWMRDAILNDNVPSVNKMANPQYFPYRYGQAMWSFITGFYGDDVIAPLFKNTAIYGLDAALEYNLSTNSENLSSMWKNAMVTHYKSYMGDRKEDPQGKLLMSDKNSGNLNVSPAISPNGKYVIFLSEKDLFSTDLFLADIRTGKVLNKVTSLVKDSDLDNLSALESSGTWSPNGKDYAFIAFKQGKNILVIKDADTGKNLDQISVPGITSISGPAWHPDGKEIVFTGLVEGHPDLYSYNLKSKKVEQLTNDIYSEILPNFNDNGSKVTFSYDKRCMIEGRVNGHITYDIAIMDWNTKNIETLDVFHGSENINPNYDHEGNIYFISERDGFRNVYRYFPLSGDVHQMTDVLTGVSGISRYSPAISVSTKRDMIVYTHYYDSEYRLYNASTKTLLNKPVSDTKSIDLKAGTLPLVQPEKAVIVQSNLTAADSWAANNPLELKNKKYDPSFKLDYIGGGTGVGVSNNTVGSATALQGGIDMIFSDMLGNNQLFSQLALNGEILDIGGQVAYLNRSQRTAWGVSLSHIPIRTGYQSGFISDSINLNGVNYPALRTDLNLIRIFDENLAVFAHYPFSTTLRLEGGVSGSRRGFRGDVYSDFYSQSGQYLDQKRERLDLGDRVTFDQFFTLVKGFGSSINTALVGDNSVFGLTSPLAGSRFRVGIEQYFGTDKYTNLTVDLRKYWWFKPFSFAVRTTNYIRMEQNVNSVYPFFIGNMGFVRGYGNIFSTNAPNDVDFNDLIGSKLSMASAEVRVPLFGPKQLSLIGSNFLLVDLELFTDVGLAFDQFKDFNASTGNKPYLAKSAGFGFRVNLFGAMIIEPHWAWPLQKGGQRTFGLNFIPGW